MLNKYTWLNRKTLQIVYVKQGKAIPVTGREGP
jgi:hypothetical protein